MSLSGVVFLQFSLSVNNTSLSNLKLPMKYNKFFLSGAGGGLTLQAAVPKMRETFASK